MLKRMISGPELGLIAITRVALGFGAGLLLAGRLEPQSRRAAGWSLLAVGALTTIPLAAAVYFGAKAAESVSRQISRPVPEQKEEVEERVPAEEL